MTEVPEIPTLLENLRGYTTMKRTREHVLETESRRALENFLPPEWIFRKKDPDYGIDIEIEIVEGGEVTNKVIWVQLKATKSTNRDQGKISYQIETKSLTHYEKCRLPVLIIYWIKSENTFYYLFAQRYIREELPKRRPDWREQKTVSLTFERKLETAQDLESTAMDGYLYLDLQQLNISSKRSAIYWLDGIPKSDDEELKERTLRVLAYLLSDKYQRAITELENILKVCTPSPTERMSVLINLGNAYYALSQYADALKNYEAILELTEKVDRGSALEGKAVALGNIGLIYRDKGDLDEALKYLKEALTILDSHRLLYGRDIITSAIESIKSNLERI